jgi:hypothetical protein
MSPFDDINPDWETFDDPSLPGWEPWVYDLDDDDLHPGGCDFCGDPDIRDTPEPFSGKPCCDKCFNVVIGGDVDDPPWRCGNASAA